MNILTDLLPKTIEVQGVRYPIDWDFRTSILFELLMCDDKIDDEEKGIKALELYFDEETLRNFNEDNIEEVKQQILWFYECGKEKTNIETDNNQNNSNSSNKRIYDYNQDDIYIYAAFKQQYGIDLQYIEGLHWWLFNAMFISLDENCKFAKILGYRSVDLDEIEDEKQRDFYRKMKEIYALPEDLAEREKYEKIKEMLARGEDPGELLHN